MFDETGFSLIVELKDDLNKVLLILRHSMQLYFKKYLAPITFS